MSSPADQPLQLAVEYFERHASGAVRLLGQGMEGAVYDLGGGLVGKLWFDRAADEIAPLQAFLVELGEQELPFRTPRITRVDSLDGHAVSVEKRLGGRPLRDVLESGALSERDGLELFVEMVEALGRTRAGAATKALPLLGEAAAPGEWGERLAELVRQRAVQSCEYLATDVENFEELLAQVLAGLSAIRLEQAQIVHGDICTPNVLVDDDVRLALLDWGFFTTAGDNTFDASTAAAFYDMYSPAARTVDDLLVQRFEALGHDRDRMYLYRAAYAIATATIYSPTAADGHYTWCVGNLNRADIRAAL
ncbi:aminoglycoside phosphotransferase family protein [Kribbella sp. CA-293567]|uniref:aminoglycoside phosphotransferase family protein n=1 Tax=Kribbella sp. CA-293567 TaxID=3002436 RepID=UPI0022DDAD39|nr:aminoglycoside phosphotransferase family protein [Kribbella sp. CA-293567]WBQ07487.1 aminoglycoside phosphotransferase family protein [Kribbella sp. CA-293567]